MAFMIKIRDLGGNIFGEYNYNQLDDQYTQKQKLEEALNNINIKNKCLESNKLIVLMNEDNYYYINFIYLKNDELNFSNYNILSNDLINTNYLNIVFRDIPISIENFKDIPNIDIDNQLYLIDYIIEYLKEDYLAYFFVNMNTDLLLFVPSNIINYKKIVLSAVRKNPDALKYASVELQADKEIVLANILERMRFRNYYYETDNYETALIYACKNKLSHIAIELIKIKYSNPGQIDEYNNTALIYACQNQLSDVALELIKTNNSNPKHENNVKETAFTLACKKKLLDVVLELIKIN